MQEARVCAGRFGMQRRESRHSVGDVEKCICDLVVLRRLAWVSAVGSAAAQDPFELVRGDGLGSYGNQGLLGDGVDEA